MRRSTLLCAAFLLAATALSVAQEDDLPAFLRGRISAAEYLRRREEYVALRRGLRGGPAGNPRAEAVRRMEAQELAMRRTNRPLGRALASAWTPVGPTAVPFFGFPPVSGRVTAIAVHPANADRLYVGTANGGLYRSLDGGASWTPLMDGALSLAIGSVAIDPVDPTRLWVGTGETNGSGDSYAGVGLYRILGADSASPRLEGPFNLGGAGTPVLMGLAVGRVAIHPSDPNTLFVAATIGGVGINPVGPPGLYRTQNALSASPTFTRLDVPAGGPLFLSWVNDAVLEPGNPDHLLCTVQGDASTGGVWRATDANAASPLFLRTQALATNARALLAIERSGATVTVLVAADEFVAPPCSAIELGTLRRSVDGGATFGPPLPAADGFAGLLGWYDIALATAPGDPSRIYLGGTLGTCGRNFMGSADGGSTFTASPETFTHLHSDTHAIAVAPSLPSTIYTGNDGGIYKSIDGGLTWASLNGPGFSATQFESIAAHPSDPQLLLGGTQDNGTMMRRSDGTWFSSDAGDGGPACIDPGVGSTGDATLYHAFPAVGGVEFARATTACAAAGRWTLRGCGPADATPSCDGTPRAAGNGVACDDRSLFYPPMALGPGTPNTLYLGTDRLYRSADGGDTMTAVSQVVDDEVSAIAVAPDDDRIRLVGTDAGVFLATRGESALADVRGAIPAQVFVERVAIDPRNHDIAYVALGTYGQVGPGQHVWKTTNLTSGAPTWVAAGGGIPDVPVLSFAIDPAGAGRLFAGTDIGVYASLDGGVTWAPYSDGLPRVPVFGMDFQAAYRLLRVATHGRGIWEIAPPLNAAGSFFTLDPCRLLDTRQVGQGPALASGVKRLVAVAGLCGIPATAKAVAANVTVVTPARAGFVTLFSGDHTVPATSTLNFPAGRTRANNAVVPLAADGSGLAAQAFVAGGGAAHLVVDVTGYFE